jgi:hypothetical protein
MIEAHTPEIRQELAAARAAALRSSARPSPPGPLRRAVGNGLVRLGLLVGSDGLDTPSPMRPELREEAPAGASSVVLAARRTSRALPAPTLVAADDLVRELAAPFGRRLGARLS